MVDYTSLLRAGEPATAVVLELRDDGAVADAPIELVLDVLPVGRPPFRATARLHRWQIQGARVQPGVQVLVTFDPDNRGKVELAGFVM